MTDLELIYVADPMCSWCYGFGPEIRALDDRFDFPTSVIVGGLRPGPAAEPLDDRLRSVLRHHWEEVGRRTGQPFDPRGLDREDWIYDTLLPDTAVVVMRQRNPDAVLPFFERLQQAFYAEGVDITNPAVYPDLLAGFDVESEEFHAALISEPAIEATYTDFGRARGLGASGFPTLFLRAGDEIFLVSRGYAQADVLAQALTAFIEDRFVTSA
jgi:putative protein-disulfide isomerase